MFRLMKARKFFFVSLSLGVIAVGCRLAALSRSSDAVLTLARATGASEAARAAAKSQADRYLEQIAAFDFMGLACAFASLAFAIVSLRCREPARRSLVWAVLALYLLVFFITV